jgi:hypothetical protein
MSKLIDDVRTEALRLAEAGVGGSPEDVFNAERELLRRLGTAMKVEESSFDAAHGFARLLGATDAHGEVRLRTDGQWVIGARDEDLLESWSRPDRPSLTELLDAIPKVFSSAKIGALLDEIRPSLANRRPG